MLDSLERIIDGEVVLAALPTVGDGMRELDGPSARGLCSSRAQKRLEFPKRPVVFWRPFQSNHVKK
jgi:hypothetical protein